MTMQHIPCMHDEFILLVQVHALKAHSATQYQCWTAWVYDNSYGFKIPIIKCICCVATATCYLQCIMHQIHLHSDFHGETVTDLCLPSNLYKKC